MTIPYDILASIDKLAQEQRTNRSEIVVRLLGEIISTKESVILHNYNEVTSHYFPLSY